MEVLARKHDISGLGLGVFLGENGWADGSRSTGGPWDLVLFGSFGFGDARG